VIYLAETVQDKQGKRKSENVNLELKGESKRYHHRPSAAATTTSIIIKSPIPGHFFSSPFPQLLSSYFHHPLNNHHKTNHSLSQHSSSPGKKRECI